MVEWSVYLRARVVRRRFLNGDNNACSRVEFPEFLLIFLLRVSLLLLPGMWAPASGVKGTIYVHA